MRRILLASNFSSNDISVLQRADGPLTLLKNKPELIIPFKQDGVDYVNSQWWLNFRNFLGMDLVLLNRPFGEYGANIIRACKIHNIPLWVDHDDDLLAIPPSNPCYGIVEEDAKQCSIEMSYREANILTCQSELMHNMLTEKYNRKDAILLPITHDDRLLRFKKPYKGNKKVSWRGSPSHKSDLLHFKIPLQALFHNFPFVEFYFFGINPRELGFEVKRLTVYPEMGMFEFYKAFTEENCSIHMVPLEDNYFNRVKSNLSWMDGTLAGAITVGPDFDTFKKPGIFNYKSVDDFYIKVANLIREEEDLTQRHIDSWSYVYENLMHSCFEDVRAGILEGV